MNVRKFAATAIPWQLAFLEFHPDYCYVLDSRNTVIFASKRVLERAPDVLCKPFHPHLATGARGSVTQAIAEAQEGRIQDNFEVELRPPGEPRQVLMFSAAPIRCVEEQPLVLLVGKDVTAARSREAAAEASATHDALTGLPNRRYLKEALTAEESRGRRYRRAFAVLFVDIDAFKSVNDTHGHKIGDDVLCAVADEIRRSTRDSDVICRYGGDEFVILMPETGTDASLAAERIRSSLEESASIRSILGRGIGVSIGSSWWNPRSSMTADDVLQQADRRMYSNKRCRRTPMSTVQRLQADLMEASSDHRRHPSLQDAA